MAKYSNVRTSSLLSAVNNAISGLGKHNLTQVKYSLSGKNILESQVKQVINSSINSIENSYQLNGSISNLKKKLLSLKSALSYIEKCQKLEKEIDDLERRLRNASDFSYRSILRQIESKTRSLRSYEVKVDNTLSR